MAERPILFSDAMVRAILAGAKTQTRRVVRRNDVVLGPSRGMHLGQGESAWHIGRGRYSISGTGAPPEFVKRGPYGAPGDRLWVREAWGARRALDFTDWHRGSLRGHVEAPPGTVVDFRADYVEQQESCFWRPSIHMPRWASRITLEVVDVRVERVQSISEEDARAEGVSPEPSAALADSPVGLTAREAFRELWDSIDERPGCSWADDPWVWVVNFRRVEVRR